MPDAPEEMPCRLTRRMPRIITGAVDWLGAVGAVMLGAAATFACAGAWRPATLLAGGCPAQGRMMASLDAGAGDADFCGDQGAPAAGLFESAGQATALSRVDMPVTAGVIIDVATSAGSAAPNFYGRLMVPMPDPAVAKPDPARMELFLAGRLTIDRVEQPGAIATQDVPAKSGS